MRKEGRKSFIGIDMSLSSFCDFFIVGYEE